jgi:hypothetical protein
MVDLTACSSVGSMAAMKGTSKAETTAAMMVVLLVDLMDYKMADMRAVQKAR